METTQTFIIPSEKFWSAVSYLGPLVFIPLLFKIKGDFVYFHNRQALAIFLVQSLLSLFIFLPVFGLLISLCGWSFCFVISLVALFSALLEKGWKIPVFYQISKLFKF